MFETLKKLSQNQRKPPMRIYMDEKTGQIVEEPLNLDSSASALINRTVKQYRNPAKEIHDFMFGR
jgi:hypothetical protein